MPNRRLQLEAADLGHDDVAQHEIERSFAREEVERRATVVRRHDPIAGPLQAGAHEIAHLRVVLDDQHALASAGGVCGRRGGRGEILRLDRGQLDPHSRPAPRLAP